MTKAEHNLESAAKWYAVNGRDGDRAIIPSIKAKFPELTAVQAIEVSKMAAELEREACHADDR